MRELGHKNLEMKNKICLITGGNAGIGRATAIGLAKLGSTVVLLCKDKLKGEETIKKLSEISESKQHKLLVGDLSVFQSIRTCVEEFEKHFDRLDILINNAGIFLTERQLIENRIEKQFAVNHLGPFLLTQLLLSSLMKSENARIINLSSTSHYFGKMRFDDLFFVKRKYNGLKAYEQSKLANVLFSYELARTLKDYGITVNCVDPGRVNTNIGNKYSSGILKYLWILNKPILVSVEKGSATSIYLATSKEVDEVTGKYFKNRKEKKSSKRSYDKKIAKRLWQISTELTGATKLKSKNEII